MKRGLLLINLGTPDSPDVRAVRKYLFEFLTDKRVIHLPVLIRYLLVVGFILPFRPRQSAHAYQAIWTPEGSPLLCNSLNLCQKLQTQLGNDYNVVLGMRYGNPNIQSALDELKHCEHITILPLYPQYSSSATGSSIENAIKHLSPQTNIPSFTVIHNFYQDQGFINAQAELIKPSLKNHDYVLFSYHGLPEKHLPKKTCQPPCMNACPPPDNHRENCYRAQCFQTTQLLANTLDLKPGNYCSAFQSRLGRTPWIKPYTDEMLVELAAKGVKHLLVTCPSFVADCLETLEEIGIRAKEQWLSLGGEQLTLVPCVNDNALWVESIIKMVKST